MCKVNIAACDKETTPHGSMLRCWPPNISYFIIHVSNDGRASTSEIRHTFPLDRVIYEV